MVTGVYPTAKTLHLGTFLKTQVDSLIEAGLQVEVIHPKPGRPPPIRYALATLQVFFKTLMGRYDIVHGHYGLWCLVARLQWTAPVVASYWGSDVLVDTTTSGAAQKNAMLVKHISRWLAHKADAVMVKSAEMKIALGAEEAIICPDGVNFALFRPMPRAEVRAALGWAQDRFYILFGNNPGRAEKDFPLAQASIERLHARGIYAELVIANGLPHTQVAQYINASNAVILSSIYEGSPNIVKEAMACNVPVVATNVGDVAQVVGHTRGCKVCPSRDPDALATALEEALLLTGPTTGRADIAHLECSVIAKQVINVYEQAMQVAAFRGHSIQTKKL